MEDWSRAKLCDIVNLSLGTILFFSPWLFSLSAGAPRQTASIIGLLIAVLSVAALAAFAVWEEWLNLVAGLWLIATPGLLGFEDKNAQPVSHRSHCRHHACSAKITQVLATVLAGGGAMRNTQRLTIQSRLKLDCSPYCHNCAW